VLYKHRFSGLFQRSWMILCADWHLIFTGCPTTVYARVSTLNNQDPEMQPRDLREYAGHRATYGSSNANICISSVVGVLHTCHWTLALDLHLSWTIHCRFYLHTSPFTEKLAGGELVPL